MYIKFSIYGKSMVISAWNLFQAVKTADEHKELNN